MQRQVQIMRISRALGAALILLIIGAAYGSAAAKTGTLKILGVPQEVAAGSYDPKEGVFCADVGDLAEALILVDFGDLQITGRQMEWQTKENYLIFKKAARLEKADFELTADLLEYFGDEERLLAQDNVVVITEEATVFADRLSYDEKTDQALFTGAVKVVFADGVLEGERFLMLLEKSELQFFGAFQGEFKADSK